VEILFLMIPLSVVLVFLILIGLYWAVEGGQFEDIERQGQQILQEDPGSQAESG
jgi:cbb3-type cytochrome oxidase maturation protein